MCEGVCHPYLYLSVEGRCAQYRDAILVDGADDADGASGSVTAPMHGMLLEMRVQAGDAVAAGQTLAVLEAMKMHHEILAEAAGTVTSVIACAGHQVAADDLLIEIE